MALTNVNGNYALDDVFLKSKIEEIIKEYGITTIVETGVHYGQSTLEFANMVSKVYAVDILQESIDIATNYVVNQHSKDNVEFFVGNSPDVLKQIVNKIDASKTIFFLDAHWWEYWPINDEIRSLEKNKGIIIVHDFVVPDRPYLGFDTYKGQPFNYQLIMNALNGWCPNHTLEYNRNATGSRRGVGFIYSLKKNNLRFVSTGGSDIKVIL